MHLSPSRILRFCDRWIYRKIKQTPQFSQKLAYFRNPQNLGLDASCDVIATSFQSKKGCFSVWKMEWTACVLIMPNLQELLRTNKPKAERIRATRLGYRPFICSCRSRGLLSITRHTVIHSAGRYSEESSQIHRRVNNISVKSCEKHSNSVKATDIRTNATDVETRRNIVQ